MWKVEYALLFRTRFLLGLSAALILAGGLWLQTAWDHGLIATAAAGAIVGALRYRGYLRDRRERMALHEAGHAVIAWREPLVADVRVVYIGKLAGQTNFDLDKCQYLEATLRSEDAAAAWLRVFFAGMTAELMRYDLPDPGGIQDYATMKDLSLRASERFGHVDGWRIGMRTAYDQATRLCSEHRTEIENLARELQRRRQLTATDLQEILGPRPVLHIPV